MYSNVTKDNDCLAELYYLKKFALMLQCIDGNFNRVEQIFADINPTINTVDELCEVICNIQEKIANLVPAEQMKEWMDADHSVFTEKHYPRCYRNEIPNDKVTQTLIEKFAELMEIGSADKAAYSISLYEFNNFDVFFENIEDAESFVNNFDCVPYTLFKEEEFARKEIRSE